MRGCTDLEELVERQEDGGRTPAGPVDVDTKQRATTFDNVFGAIHPDAGFERERGKLEAWTGEIIRERRQSDHALRFSAVSATRAFSASISCFQFSNARAARTCRPVIIHDHLRQPTCAHQKYDYNSRFRCNQRSSDAATAGPEGRTCPESAADRADHRPS